MKKQLFFVLICMCTILSCKKDDSDFTKKDDTTTQKPPEENTTFDDFKSGNTVLDVLVEVKDNQNNLLENVAVTIASTTINTNSLGIANFKDIAASENFLYAKTEKSGFVNGSKTVIPQKNTTTLISIKLLPIGVVKTVKTGEASTVALNDGTKLELSNTYFDAQGNEVSGDLDVCIHHLSPDEESTFETMPGALLAEQSNGSIRTLETYGMVAVDILDQSGNHVNINKDNPAKITFPIASTQMGIAPEEIPLWYFDEEKGIWVEEGKAILEGDHYTGTVSHFSWWNVDFPLDFVTLETTITEKSSGAALNDIYVEIIRESTGQKIYQGCSSLNGVLKGQIPFNEEIRVKIKPKNGGCSDDFIYDEIVGPFIENSNLNIAVDLKTNASTFTIKGKINNCKGGDVADGLIIINSPTSSFKHFTDPAKDGAFEFEYSTCNLETISIVGYDLVRDKQFESIEIDLSTANSTIDLGEINSCEVITDDIVFEGFKRISNQEELNEFTEGGYTKVNGSITITGVEDLSALDLKTVTGSLRIGSSPALSNLVGLEKLETALEVVISSSHALLKIDEFINLKEVKNIEISNLDNVTTIEGFEKLTTCEKVEIKNCDLLTTLTGFEALNKLRRLAISSQEALETITAFTNLTQIQYLSMVRSGIKNVDFLSNLTTLAPYEDGTNEAVQINFYLNKKLTQINGLSNLNLSSNASSASLRVNWNEELTSLKGLNTFDNENGSVAIIDNSKLTTFDTFKITKTRSLEITNNSILSNFDDIDLSGVLNHVSIKNNAQLNSIKGLKNVNEINSIYIEENNTLTTLEGLENLETIDNITIDDNPALLNTDALSKVSKGTNNNLVPNAINIRNNNALTSINLTALTELRGSMYITGNDMLTDITNLDKLTKVGAFFISNNDALTSLQGLNKLNSVNNFKCISNNQLTSLDGLEKLNSVTFLGIIDNLLLSNINALSNLKNGTIDNSNILEIDIVENPALQNLNGLSGITEVERGLVISKNNALTDLSGLEQLETVNEDFYITNNNGITSLNGLDGLTKTGHFYVVRNNGLLNLTGVETLKATNRITVSDNAMLQNINALSNVSEGFPTAATGVQTLYIEKNPQLINLNGVGSITKLYQLKINENDLLTNLEGLNNLTEIDLLEIESQGSSFTSLQGLDNLTTISRGISIDKNTGLTNFCALQGINYTGTNLGLNVTRNAYNPDIVNMTTENCSE